MWRNSLTIIGIIVVLFGGAALGVWFLISPSADQAKVPLFIAALSSLFSAIGAVASGLVVLEMKRDREALFKPDIYADFEVDEGLFTFVVRNDGQSAAKKVQVKIDPIPIGFNNQPIDNVAWLREPIETLLPGKKLAKTIDSHVSLLGGNRPCEFKISITYQSLSGKKYIEAPYIIDLEEYRNSQVPTPHPDKSLRIIADQIKKIADK